MRKETDLARVKMIAHVLLDMPIAETSFSPAIFEKNSLLTPDATISLLHSQE